MSDRWRDEVDDVANTTCPDCGFYVPRNEDGLLEEHQRWTDDGHAVTCTGTATSARDQAVKRDARAQGCDG
ncbi:MAG: hypothetical protein INR72_16175 [Williamsia herbipolensis]|nr:hypothetical protein [Williamsia herbipolensis]